MLGLERLEQVAEIGLVEILHEPLQEFGIRGFDGIGGGGQELRIEFAFLVPEGRSDRFRPFGRSEAASCRRLPA